MIKRSSNDGKIPFCRCVTIFTVKFYRQKSLLESRRNMQVWLKNT